MSSLTASALTEVAKVAKMPPETNTPKKAIRTGKIGPRRERAAALVEVAKVAKVAAGTNWPKKAIRIARIGPGRERAAAM